MTAPAVTEIPLAPTADPEQDLVSRFLAGDEDGMEAVYRRWAPSSCRLRGSRWGTARRPRTSPRRCSSPPGAAATDTVRPVGRWPPGSWASPGARSPTR